MAKKVQREKSLRFDRTYKLIIYHCLLKFITYPILTGGFWVLRLHFRIASQLSSLLMNLKVLIQYYEKVEIQIFYYQDILLLSYSSHSPSDTQGANNISPF